MRATRTRDAACAANGRSRCATLAELPKRFDLHANQIATWKEQLIASASNAFGVDAEATEPPVDIKTLRRAERKAMIDRTHALPLSKQARVVSISRASVY